MGIKIVDHRGDGDPETTYEQFDDHESYLRRMGELGSPPTGCVVKETTWSRVDIIPRSKQQELIESDE